MNGPIPPSALHTDGTRWRFFRLSVRYTARGTQRAVPEGSTHIPRVRALIRSRMYGFAKSHPEGLATRTKLRLLSERPSQAQGPQSSARRRSTRNPLPSSDKSAGRILKCPKDGALSSSPASPPSPACTRHDVPHRESRVTLNGRMPCKHAHVIVNVSVVVNATVHLMHAAHCTPTAAHAMSNSSLLSVTCVVWIVHLPRAAHPHRASCRSLT